MSRQVVGTVLVLFVVALLAVAAFYFSRLRFGTAIRRIVRVLRERGATDSANAIRPEALGIVSRTLWVPRMAVRDYRPQALRLLTQAGIVRMTEDGGLYLSEQELERSQLKKLAKIE